MQALYGLAIILALPAYVVAQIVVLIRWRGWALWLSLIPLAAMAGAFLVFLEATAQGSNLAPLFMVLLAPFCLVWLWVVSLFRR